MAITRKYQIQKGKYNPAAKPAPKPKTSKGPMGGGIVGAVIDRARTRKKPTAPKGNWNTPKRTPGDGK